MCSDFWIKNMQSDLKHWFFFLCMSNAAIIDSHMHTFSVKFQLPFFFFKNCEKLENLLYTQICHKKWQSQELIRWWDIRYFNFVTYFSGIFPEKCRKALWNCASQLGFPPLPFCFVRAGQYKETIFKDAAELLNCQLTSITHNLRK